MNSTSRIKEVDILRCFACLSVIVIHTTAAVMQFPGDEQAIYFYTVLNRGAQFAVPLFIFISGLVLYRKYGSEDQDFPYLKFLWKRIRSLLFPYLFWSTAIYCYFLLKDYRAFDISAFFRDLALGNICYHFYYVIVIFQFYLLFGLFRWIMHRVSTQNVLLFSFLINLIALILKNTLDVPNYIGRLPFPTYLFFFILGCNFAIHYRSIVKIFERKISTLLFLIGFQTLKALFLAFLYQRDSSFYQVVWLFTTTIDIYVFAWCFRAWETRIFRFLERPILAIGDASYQIYLLHPLLIYMIGDLLTSMFLESIHTYFLSLFFSVAILSTTIAILIRKQVPKKR